MQVDRRLAGPEHARRGCGEESSVTETILLVAHGAWREGRVAPMLKAKGYAVQWCCPAKGDRLPDDSRAYAGTVVFGGVQSANDGPTTPYIQHELDWIADYVGGGGRYLGICLGGQLLAKALGGSVGRHAEGVNEIGYYPLRPTAAGRHLFPDGLQVYHWHQEGFEVPAGCELLALGAAFPNQAFRFGDAAYGLQFHPEVRPTDARAWIDTVPHQLARPGAQSREAQEAGFVRHDASLTAWLDGFLDHWLAGAVAGSSATTAGQPLDSIARRPCIARLE
jgi:GMP synthase (glutamine-hydrolysing)